MIFESTAGALEALLAEGNFDPAAFHAALEQLPIKEKSTEARILIATAVVVYQRYGKAVTLDRASYVAAGIGAVGDGIRAGLATSPK